MRSVVHETHGEPSEVLHVREVAALPEPSGVEVLVRVTTRPVNLGALLGVRGRYRAPGHETDEPSQPTAIGVEGVGIIEALGGRATEENPALVLGQRVVVFPVSGSSSEQILVPASVVFPVPAEIPDGIAAQLLLNPVTALLLLRAAEAAGARSSDEGMIVVDAASSSVARLVAAVARRRFIQVAGVFRSAPPFALTQDLSAVVCTSLTDWQIKLRDASRGKGFRVALDAVGGEIGTALAHSLGQGGTLLTYGDLSGDPLQINALTITARDLHVSGIIYARWSSEPAQVKAADVALAFELARTRPDLFPVAASYDLEQVAEAVTHAERPGKHGLVMLTSPAR